MMMVLLFIHHFSSLKMVTRPRKASQLLMAIFLRGSLHQNHERHIHEPIVPNLPAPDPRPSSDASFHGPLLMPHSRTTEFSDQDCHCILEVSRSHLAGHHMTAGQILPIQTNADTNATNIHSNLFGRHSPGLISISLRHLFFSKPLSPSHRPSLPRPSPTSSLYPRLLVRRPIHW